VALVYDVTDVASLKNLPHWHTEINAVIPQARFRAAGNKCDLRRTAPRDQALNWAREHNLPHIETSALTGDGVETFFKGLAWLALHRS
jgi:GTPase SAR1 family protein